MQTTIGLDRMESRDQRFRRISSGRLDPKNLRKLSE